MHRKEEDNMLYDIIDFFTAGIVYLLSWFLGGRDGFVNVLLTFVIIDYIMGLIVAYSRHELSNSIGIQESFHILLC